jgi:serine protease Do
VRPGRSLFNDTYDAALASYHEAHYRKALDLFSQIDRISPGHPYVGQYIALSQKAVDEGRDRGWIAGWWPGIAGLLIACIVGYVVRRRVMLRRPPTARVRVLPN